MFKNSQAFSSFSVNDIEKAKNFYGKILGLDVSEVPEMSGLIRLRFGDGTALIYAKTDHVPATFTVLNFPVSDLEETVDKLAGLGIRCEVYDTETIRTDQRGIHKRDGHEIAWFKDPAGNILSVLKESPEK